MRKKRIRQWNKWLLALCVWLALFCSCVYAAETGSLEVILRNESGSEPAADIDVYLHLVARSYGWDDMEYTDEFQAVEFTPHELFHEDRSENALKLYQYVCDHDLAGEVKATGEDGHVRFTELLEGAYLIHVAENQAVTFRPFLVFIPTEHDAVDYYDVQAQPKTEDQTVIPTQPDTGPTEPDETGPTNPTKPGETDQTGQTKPDETDSTRPTEPDETDPMRPTKPGAPDPEFPTKSGETEEEGPEVPELEQSEEGRRNEDDHGGEAYEENMIPQTGTNMIPIYALIAGGVLLVILGIADLARGGDRNG